MPIARDVKEDHQADSLLRSAFDNEEHWRLSISCRDPVFGASLVVATVPIRWKVSCRGARQEPAHQLDSLETVLIGEVPPVANCEAIGCERAIPAHVMGHPTRMSAQRP